MTTLLSMDAGLRGCGLGLFEGCELVRAAYIKNPERVKRGGMAWHPLVNAVLAWLGPVPVDVFVGEEMQKDARTGGKEKDVLQVQAVVGAISGAVRPRLACASYTPTKWKGSVPGDVMCKRIEARLTPEERARVEPCAPSLMHNLWDGVGVGLYHLGRLEPKRVFAR